MKPRSFHRRSAGLAAFAAGFACWLAPRHVCAQGATWHEVPPDQIVAGATFRSRTPEVMNKSAVLFKGVQTVERSALPGNMMRRYSYDALLIDGEVTLTDDLTLELSRGTLFLSVATIDAPPPPPAPPAAPGPTSPADGTVVKAVAVPWWYPLVVGKATQSGTIGTKFIVQASPRVVGPTLNRVFLVACDAGHTGPDVWTNRGDLAKSDPPGTDHTTPQALLSTPGTYVLGEGPRRNVQLTVRTLNPSDDEGESGVANAIYSEAIAWATQCGLYP